MSVSTIGAFVIGEYPEAVAVMLFYQVGEFFQSLAVKRSRKSISDLMDIRPDSATVRRNGELITISPENVHQIHAPLKCSSQLAIQHLHQE